MVFSTLTIGSHSEKSPEEAILPAVPRAGRGQHSLLILEDMASAPDPLPEMRTTRGPAVCLPTCLPCGDQVISLAAGSEGREENRGREGLPNGLQSLRGEEEISFSSCPLKVVELSLLGRGLGGGTSPSEAPPSLSGPAHQLPPEDSGTLVAPQPSIWPGGSLGSRLDLWAGGQPDWWVGPVLRRGAQ